MNWSGVVSQPRWRILGFLCLAGMLNYADRAAFSSVLPPLREALRLSDTELGLLSSLFLWSYAVAGPVAGLMADRYSRSSIVIWSLIGWSAVTFLTGLTNGLIMLIVLRTGLGISQSLYLPAGLALIADHHGAATRGRAFSVHSVALNLGIVVGGTGAGFMAEHFGWRSGFLVLGAVGVAVAILARRGFSAGAEIGAVTAAPRPAVMEVLRYLIRVPTFHMILAKIMLSGFTIWIFISWLPLYFREVLHLSLGAAGFAGTFILQVSFVVGLAAGGWISDRWSEGDPRRRLLMLAGCYLAASPFLLIFLAEPGLAAVAVGISLFSLLRGMGDSCEKPALCEVVPARYRATAISLMNTLATANGGIGVFLVGFLKSSMSLNAMFACLSVFLLLAGIVSWLGWRFFMTRDMARTREHEASFAAAPPPASPA
jgi:sugar phosphate permease